MRKWEEVPPVLLSTTEELTGYRVTRHVGLALGTSREWTEAGKACWEAIEDMIGEATQMGAQAVVGVRMDMTAAGEGAYVTATAYGTGVEVELMGPAARAPRPARGPGAEAPGG